MHVTTAGDMGKYAHPGMQFACGERLEDMPAHGRDRFCLSCRKPVIDFTDWDREALVAYFKERPDTCGQFRAEQVDPQLVALPEKSSSWRSGSLALLAALAIQGSQAQHVPGTPDATEQTSVPAPTEASPHFKTVKAGPSEIGMKEDGAYCKKLDPVPRRRPRYRVFVSGQFPFVHVRERVVRGKFRITGCPSF